MPKVAPSAVLKIEWQFGPKGYIDSGELTLESLDGLNLKQVELHVSGVVRFTDSTPISGATLVKHLSNYAVFSPASESINADRWSFSVGEPDYPMRHYSEGIVSAFLRCADGSLVDVEVCQCAMQEGAKQAEPTSLIVAHQLTEANDKSWCIVPWPNQVALEGELSAPKVLKLVGDNKSAAAVRSFIGLAECLFPDEDWYRASDGETLEVTFKSDDSFSEEQYRLKFESSGVVVGASSTTGYLYGLITLGQLCRASINDASMPFPAAGTIEDAPAYSWRGCHLDVARQFYQVDSVERFLCVMAWNKLNRFHWHLSDDEGWRVEVKAYPELTEVGAWRGLDHAIPPVLGTGLNTEGGFYIQEQVKQIVKLAKQLGISVVPELDMPGHSFAALQSLPELADPLEPQSYRSLQGFSNNCLNPSRPETFTFINAVLDELLPLFPDNVWHVGADEVPDNAWHAAPSVMAEGSTNAPSAKTLQSQFLQQLQAVLRQRGVVTGAWQEAAMESGISTDSSYLVAWLDTEIAKKLASDGYNVVVSAGQAYYLDMAMADDWSEPGLGWAGSVSLEQSYGFDPTQQWPDELKAKCLGVQACIWSEQMTSTEIFDYLVFPRLSAMAETAWTKKSNKDWKRFSKTCNTMPRLFNR